MAPKSQYRHNVRKMKHMKKYTCTMITMRTLCARREHAVHSNCLRAVEASWAV